jgi:hypothetical protein
VCSKTYFISYGIPSEGDAKWLDQKGSYMATIAAGEVFKLLGAKDLGVSNDYHKEVCLLIIPVCSTDIWHGDNMTEVIQMLPI